MEWREFSIRIFTIYTRWKSAAQQLCICSIFYGYVCYVHIYTARYKCAAGFLYLNIITLGTVMLIKTSTSINVCYAFVLKWKWLQERKEEKNQQLNRICNPFRLWIFRFLWNFLCKYMTNAYQFSFNELYITLYVSSQTSFYRHFKYSNHNKCNSPKWLKL